MPTISDMRSKKTIICRGNSPPLAGCSTCVAPTTYEPRTVKSAATKAKRRNLTSGIPLSVKRRGGQRHQP